MVTAPSEMSIDEWASLDEDSPGELVDGMLEEEEAPDITHETVVRWLMLVLAARLQPAGGLVFGSGVKLAVRARRGRLADLICYAPGRRPPKRGVVRLPPDIVVEVVSPSPADARRDRIEKPDDYAAFGVRYYWLVDPELRGFEVWELGSDGRYVRARSAVSGVVEVDVPGCDPLALDLDALWREVDELPA